MAYRAEIEIGIKGAARLKDLQNRLKNLATLIDENNKKPLFDRVAVQSVNQYADALSTAKKNLDQVQIELNDAGKATGNYSKNIKEFVTALGAANQAQKITNNLIDQEISARTQATAVLKAYNAAAAAPTQRGAATTMSGGYLRGAFRGGSQYPGAIGPGAVSSTALSSPLPARSARTTQYLSPIGPISPQERTGRAEQLAREAALKSQTNQKEFAAQKAFQTELFNIKKRFDDSLNRQRKEADDAEFDRLLKRLNAEQSKLNEIDKLRAKIDKKVGKDFEKRSTQAGNLRGQTSPVGGAVGIPGSPAAKQRAVRNKRLEGAASNAIIGGAFPLLFGQGAGAAVGGAAGGALGGLAGGQFGFGLSLVGTAIGTAVDSLVNSTSELGKALNPLTADIGAVTAAAGESGTAFEQLVKDLEKVVGKEKALAVATAQLATVIGTDGVAALRKLGAETTDLGNEVSVALSLASSAIAEFINQTGFLAALINGIETSNLKKAAGRNTTDPELQRLKEARANITPATANPTVSFAGITIASDLEAQIDAADAAIVARQRVLEIEEQINIKTQAGVDIARTKAILTNLEIKVLSAENDVIQTGNSLLEENNYEAQRSVIFARTRLEAKQAENDVDKIALILAKEKNALDALKAKRAQEAASDQKAAAREAEQAAKKELQVRQALAQLDINAYNIAIETIQATEGDLAAIKEQLRNQDALLLKRIEIIKLSDKNKQIQELEIKIAKDQSFLEQVRLRNKKEELAVQKAITALKQAEETEGIERNLTRGIEDIERKIASPFGGDQAEQIDLLVEQQRRYKDVTDQVKTSIEEQKNLELVDTSGAATRRREALEEQLGIYEKLLLQLNAVEQAELRQNQLMKKYGFIANEAATAMSSAVQSVITGTGSVQEAFSNMFANIGKAFIDMATQMIAKALVMKAIGILTSAFGGGAAAGAQGIGAAAAGGFSFAGGGYTGDGPRSGGVDGQGGFPAILHPQEYVYDGFAATRDALTISNDNETGTTEQDSALSDSRSYITNNRYGSEQAYRDSQAALMSSSTTTERTIERQMLEQQLANPSAIKLDVETTVINSVEYLTVEQGQRMSDAAARKARGQVFSDLKNRPSSRRQVGLR